MRKNTIPLLILFCIILPLNAQVSLDGVAFKLPYSGLQPEMIDGVSALPAIEKPLLRHIYMVDKNVIAFTVDERSVILSNLKPYKAETGDTMYMEGYNHMFKVLVRDEERIGYLCGIDNEWYRPFNHITGEKLALDWLETRRNISIQSDQDADFAEAVYPEAIYRKSYSIDRTHTGRYQHYPLRHEIYCVLPVGLTSGNTYSIRLNNEVFRNDIILQFKDRDLRTEAIHVNLHGFLPWENKIAFVSTWLGDGESFSYKNDLPYSIIDVNTGQEVFRGNTYLKQPADKPEYTIRNRTYNHNQTDVLAMDFSNLREPGTYRIVLDGIGCSFEFDINDQTMEDMSRLLMKGFLHQRSGIELGPPYTNYLRPRNMHPADKTTIHTCDVNLFFNPPEELNQSGQTSVFQRIQASIQTDTDVMEAWGGWMDAGDFDQRMTHFTTVRRMMFLYEMNPAFYEERSYGIPESINNIPDILDEARWCLDLQRRTQGTYEEGGISWWVESVEHPRGGEPSWLNSLPTAIVPPTPRASLNYAATAAQMALLVKKYDPVLSSDYLESARAAIEWVDRHPDVPDPFGSYPRAVTEAMAFVNMYRATGDIAWHERFITVLPQAFKNGIVENASANTIEVCINYTLIDNLQTDESITEQSKLAIIKVADALLQGARENTYGVLKDPEQELNRLATFSRLALPVATAHYLTGDMKYIHALTATLQYALGANPMNRCYISGLGERWFAPYSIDWEVTNSPMPAGIPNFGPIKASEERWGWQGNWGIIALREAGLYPPDLLAWPHPERCFNQAWMAPTNEFTVASPMGDLLVISAYLAQHKNSN
ncbi:glycoside hydrolase family 9 protein [Bacteroidota bacterium]